PGWSLAPREGARPLEGPGYDPTGFPAPAPDDAHRPGRRRRRDFAPPPAGLAGADDAGDGGRHRLGLHVRLGARHRRRDGRQARPRGHPRHGAGRGREAADRVLTRPARSPLTPGPSPPSTGARGETTPVAADPLPHLSTFARAAELGSFTA